ncbi:MAG: GNAT family N-acetyltransferase [Clostridia bacterium]|nr:GNAT family N-acetyltransferase [Clostridia bacterium]
MVIRRATPTDTPDLNRLLYQVLAVHHEGRPDIFKGGVKKYTDEELFALIADDNTPIFVAVNEKGAVMGYAFCQFQQHVDNHILTDIKTLYIDDLCVDETCRGQHIGRALYEFCVDFARRSGCYNLTLNVWSCNQSALRFYEKCGLLPQKIGMEKIL